MVNTGLLGSSHITSSESSLGLLGTVFSGASCAALSQTSYFLQLRNQGSGVNEPVHSKVRHIGPAEHGLRPNRISKNEEHWL